MQNFHCDLCEFKTIYKSSLKDHVNKLHNNESEHNKSFQCSDCNKLFQTDHILRRHFQRIHEKQQNHACEQCELKFYSKVELKRHIRRKHTTYLTKEDRFECLDCKKTFSEKHSLSRHFARIHEKNQKERM